MFQRQKRCRGPVFPVEMSFDVGFERPKHHIRSRARMSVYVAGCCLDKSLAQISRANEPGRLDEEKRRFCRPNKARQWARLLSGGSG